MLLFQLGQSFFHHFAAFDRVLELFGKTVAIGMTLIFLVCRLRLAG